MIDSAGFRFLKRNLKQMNFNPVLFICFKVRHSSSISPMRSKAIWWSGALGRVSWTTVGFGWFREGS